MGLNLTTKAAVGVTVAICVLGWIVFTTLGATLYRYIFRGGRYRRYTGPPPPTRRVKIGPEAPKLFDAYCVPSGEHHTKLDVIQVRRGHALPWQAYFGSS
jgi:hypothetical protein